MLNRFQQVSCATFKEHADIKETHQLQFLDWSLGLSGEVGEVTELVKHHIFHNEDLDKMELAKELGDVLWYVAAMATSAGLNLQDIAELNMAKLQHRHGQSFNAKGSANRHVRELAFKETAAYTCLEARLMQKDAPVNVIFIGPDGSGKTTISGVVADKLGYRYHKCDYRQAAKSQLSQVLLDSQIDVVYDRFYYPDDIIYSKVKGHEMSAQDIQEYEKVVASMLSRNVIFVYVDAELETLQKRSGVWIDDYVTQNDLLPIKEEYAIWMEVYGKAFPILRYDTTDIEVDTADYNELLDTMVEDIKAVADRYYSTKTAGEEA